ncbi:formiminotransferase-cyclodeaminase [candidate division TA06 bacterium DG_24]|uniref:Formimidoyltransferase-cyclodeaminase n=3 Tax=Bacteria division TA06 TaxID=1156500 RepID=A0A0S8JP08_UNCT6|nr:MAG: formiminotransferase-cyclodeaminase [candidate division TA06 bacterium DG_24]KPK71232.1 MAG: formiminotransferase-cyclodeaminase [candidate division TA06 bacterium SM23_40]KPL11481.1 MAG: formiminotransferase-cyclodeaminase [candidate division TA06 bacterium SM1_40]
MLRLVECVPNFSEGRDMDIVNNISAEISSTAEVKLLDVDPGRDTNRTVVTFIGSPEGVIEAAFNAIRKAAELIDMSKHEGAHARMGATDVCPLVPVSGVTMDDCVELARRLGKRVADELKIPVYLYENAATVPERRKLPTIRKGEYEGLADKLKDPQWKPDFGEPVFNPRSGATVVGAREFLIAYNINLNTTDARLAKEIAFNIRETGKAKRDKDGRIVRDENGRALRQPGTLKACNATGWYLDDFGIAQVTMNLINYKVTPPHVAFEEVVREADRLGLRVTGSELVGLIPKAAVLEAGRYFLQKQGKSAGVPEEVLIETAIRSMGFREIAEFDPRKKIIEYQFGRNEDSLVSKDIQSFMNELSVDSPAPGGGSAAALCGALAASLASMVANLTFGKKEYRDSQDEMERIAVRAQELKDGFVAAIDRDTAAFNRVMAAFRLRKKTDEDKARRQEAIQEATKQATLVPLEVLETSVEALKLALRVAEKGLRTSVSDAGVAGVAGRAAAIGAYYNVRINLASITDEAFVGKVRNQATTYRDEALKLADRIAEAVGQELEK